MGHNPLTANPFREEPCNSFQSLDLSIVFLLTAAGIVMPDLIGPLKPLIKTIDNCKNQNLLHGFCAEALKVRELQLFLNRFFVIRHFVSHW